LTTAVVVFTTEASMSSSRTRRAFVTLGLLAAATVAAQDAPPAQPVTLGVLTSFTLTHNFNDPLDHANGLRAYDTREDELSLDVVEAVIQRKVATAGDVGFRFDLTAGSAIPHVAAASGLFRDPSSGKAEDIDILQGYGSYVADLGRGLRLDIGKFTALIGYESVEGVDGWNDTVSRSLLFLAAPTTHTGVRASTQLSDAVSGVLYVVTGCDMVEDVNGSPSAGLQLGIARPGSPFSMVINYLGGPEKTDNSSDLRHQVDLVGKVALSRKLTLGVELLSGGEEGSAADGGSASWSGAALYLRSDPGPRLVLALRAESFNDRDGNRTGAVQRLVEATLALHCTMAEGLYLRAEARYDHSDEDVFLGGDGYRGSQPTLALNVIWSDANVLER